MSNREHIEKVETWNSGGNIMLDIVTLKDGTVIVISDDLIVQYPTLGVFLDGDIHPEQYGNKTIERITTDTGENDGHQM